MTWDFCKKEEKMREIIDSPTVKWNDRQGHIPDMICCHQTGCSAEAFMNAVLNPQKRVSAHFFVSKEGRTCRFADIDKMVPANPTDCENPFRKNHYSRSLNPIVRNRKTNADFYTVSVFFENNRSGVLTYAQYDAGLRLFIGIIAKLQKQYGLNFSVDREHIVGHYEIAPAAAMNCPGIDFPFYCFIKDLK